VKQILIFDRRGPAQLVTVTGGNVAQIDHAQDDATAKSLIDNVQYDVAFIALSDASTDGELQVAERLRRRAPWTHLLLVEIGARTNDLANFLSEHPCVKSMCLQGQERLELERMLEDMNWTIQARSDLEAAIWEFGVIVEDLDAVRPPDLQSGAVIDPRSPVVVRALRAMEGAADLLETLPYVHLSSSTNMRSNPRFIEFVCEFQTQELRQLYKELAIAGECGSKQFFWDAYAKAKRHAKQSLRICMALTKSFDEPETLIDALRLNKETLSTDLIVRATLCTLARDVLRIIPPRLANLGVRKLDDLALSIAQRLNILVEGSAFTLLRSVDRFVLLRLHRLMLDVLPVNAASKRRVTRLMTLLRRFVLLLKSVNSRQSLVDHDEAVRSWTLSALEACAWWRWSVRNPSAGTTIFKFWTASTFSAGETSLFSIMWKQSCVRAKVRWTNFPSG